MGDSAEVSFAPASRGAGRIPQPPFNAGALKRSALDNAEAYRKLFNTRERPSHGSIIDDESQHDVVVAQTHSTQSDPEASARRNIAQLDLIRDARDLIRASAYLENRLKEKRHRIWLVYGLFALICQAALHTRWLRQLLQFRVPAWATFIAYPIAGYGIMKRERGISCTGVVREGAHHLCGLVERGQPLRDGDLECFTGLEWEGTPWRAIEEID